MFERFTDRARRVLVFAHEEAGRLGHDHVGPEHLLLGLVREDEGMAAKALEALGIALSEVQERVEERVEALTGRSKGATAEQLAFAPATKRVLELALREAQTLGHSYIGTEHVLLGLVREGEGVAAQVLGQLGASLASVRRQVIRTVSGRAAEPAQGEATEPGAHHHAWQEVGWTLLARGTERTWRALRLARQEAAVDAHPAVEVSDLVMGVLRAGDPQVTDALSKAGAVGASPAELEPDASDATEPPARPLSAQARDAFAQAVRLADDDAATLGPSQLLLGCLSVLDPEAVDAVAARLGVEAGRLVEHLSQDPGRTAP